MTTQANGGQDPGHDTGSDGREREERDRVREEIEPELAPYVDRSRPAAFRRRDAIEARWRAWRSEPAPRLDGEAVLARTEQRLHAFCQGDRYGYDATVRWPMTEAQREAVREAAEARTGAERLRAIADLVEVSPYFETMRAGLRGPAAGRPHLAGPARERRRGMALTCWTIRGPRGRYVHCAKSTWGRCAGR